MLQTLWTLVLSTYGITVNVEEVILLLRQPIGVLEATVRASSAGWTCGDHVRIGLIDVGVKLL